MANSAFRFNIESSFMVDESPIDRSIYFDTLFFCSLRRPIFADWTFSKLSWMS
jgi:hypothetical protein